MDFTIDPLKGVGPIRFGMDSETIQKLVGGRINQFKKSPTSLEYTDAFLDHHIHVYYKANGECEAIEFGPGSNPMFMSNSLIGRQYRVIQTLFEQLDDSVELEDSGLTSYRYGVGVYAPDAIDSPDEPVEGVIVFEQGYYE